MYHLSKELTGVVLQHDTYGSHLDSGGKTIDEDLEKKNFEAAGKTLCSIWSNLIEKSYLLFTCFMIILITTVSFPHSFHSNAMTMYGALNIE